MLKNKIAAYAARIVVAGAAAGALALGSAAIAAADTASLLNVGDDNLGVTVGTTGGSAALGGTRVTVDGWPTSTTTIVGKNPLTGMTVYTYTATTNYYDYDGGISHTSSLVSEPFSFQNAFKVNAMDGLDQRADLRLGMTTVTCRDFVNCSVAGSG